MNLRELIKKIDYSKIEDCWIPEDFLEEFGILYNHVDYQKFREHVKQVPIHTWICTDTEVGIHAYTLDDVLVALSFKRYRKSTRCINFISKATADFMYEFLGTIIEDPFNQVVILDMELNIELLHEGFDLKTTKEG